MITTKQFAILLKKVGRHSGPYEDFGIRLSKAGAIAFEMDCEGRELFSKNAFGFLFDERNLRIAMEYLRRKGGHAPGPDKIEYSEWPTNEDRFAECRAYRDSIKAQAYTPGTYRTIEIPKASGGVRQITLMNVRDRIVLRGIKQVLEPFVDCAFQDNSYGFRPKRNRQQMVAKACEIALESERYFWVKADIKEAFPSVPPNAVLELIRQQVDSQPLVELISKFLKRKSRVKGLLQGSPLSPLCLNLYLHDRIDRLWEKKHFKTPMLRYADDFLILAKTKAEATRALKNLSFLAGKAGLELKSTERSTIRDLVNGERITTLGMNCGLTEDGKLEIRPSKRSFTKLLEQIETLEDGDNTVNRIFRKIKGWIAQQSLAYDSSISPKIISKIVAEIEKRQLQNDFPQQFYDDDGFEICGHYNFWQLGDSERWHAYWIKQNQRIKMHLEQV